MAKVSGSLNWATNYNIGATAPVDARTMVENLTDLTNPNTWKDGEYPVYQDMTVDVIGGGYITTNGFADTAPADVATIISEVPAHTTWKLIGYTITGNHNQINKSAWKRVDAGAPGNLTLTPKKAEDNITLTQTEAEGLRAGVVKLSDIYVTSNGVLNDDSLVVKAGDTLDVAIGKITKFNNEFSGSVTNVILENEEVTSNALNDLNTRVIDLSGTTQSFSASTVDNLDILYDTTADIQSELNTTQTGAGLSGSGIYVKNTSAKYIAAATSLNDADVKLDAKLWELSGNTITSANTLQSELNTTQTGAGLSGSGTYVKNTSANYISAATSLNNADVKLDTALKTEETNRIAKDKSLQNQIDGLSITGVSGTELTGLGENVKEAYKFVNASGVQQGTYIKIYKDSALQKVELDGQELVFTYILADGTESVVRVDVSVFLTEKEYADGLQVNDHIISVKRDTTSEAFLTVGSNGIKLSGVQTAIDTAKNTLQSELNTTQTGAGLSGSGTYVKNTSANYISAATSLNNADVKLDTALKTEETNRIAKDNALQSELDTTQTGAGLSGSGIYIKNTSANYISAATSLNDADVKLDTALKAEETARITKDNALQSELNTTQTGAGLSGSGIYVKNTSAKYIAAATSLNDADVKLDAKLWELSGNTITSANTLNTAINQLRDDTKTSANTLNNAINTLNDFMGFMTGHRTVTSLSNVPVNKRLVVATISANATLSLSGIPADGYEIHIMVKNNASTKITITLPSEYVSGQTFVIPGNSWGEINVISDGTKIYVRGV